MVQPSQAKVAYSLDALNFFIADVRDGIVPYLGFLLALKPGWTPSQIGWVLSIGGTTALLTSPLLGFLFDRSRHKRVLLLFAVATIGVCAFAITVFSSVLPLFIVQATSGLANALIGPGVVAISLGIVGPRLLAQRIARNESFNYMGNCVGAFACVLLVRSVSNLAPFYFAAGTSVLALAVLCAIRPKNINDNQARGFLKGDTQHTPESFRELLSNPHLLIFLVVATAFQFANASLLPIATQVITRKSASDASDFVTWGVAVAQFTAIPAAWTAGYISRKFSSYTCLLIGLLAILARAVIFGTLTNLHVLIAAQALDGVAAGVLAVAPILALAELVRGSGRFTFAAGVLMTSVSIGASLSTVVSGYVLEYFGSSFYFHMVELVITGTCLTMLMFKNAFPQKHHGQ